MGETSQSPLYEKRILITRAKEQSESLFQQLLALDAIPICAPLIQFAPPEDSDPLDRALRNLGSFDWLFLTSQNALRFVLERAELIGVSLTGAPCKFHVAAVAPVTAAAAERAGLRVEYVSKKHQGIGLAEELGPRLNGLRVFLPRSDKASTALPVALERAGAQVEDVIAYRTLQTQTADEWLAHIVSRGEIDAMVFFSPSAVHYLAEILGSDEMEKAKQRILVVAIGPVTAKALMESGFARISQAPDTETNAVLSTLAQAFDSAAPGTSSGVELR